MLISWVLVGIVLLALGGCIWKLRREYLDLQASFKLQAQRYQTLQEDYRRCQRQKVALAEKVQSVVRRTRSYTKRRK